MTRRIHEIDYVLENNQMKEFVDENINHLKFEKVYAEVPQTSEIQFNEYDGKLEVVDEKGELIFEELTNFNNVSTDSYGKNFNTFNQQKWNDNELAVNKLYNQNGSDYENRLVTPIKTGLFSSAKQNGDGGLETVGKNFNNFDSYGDVDLGQVGKKQISQFQRSDIRPEKEASDVEVQKKGLFAAMREARNGPDSLKQLNKQNEAKRVDQGKRNLFSEIMSGFGKYNQGQDDD